MGKSLDPMKAREIREALHARVDQFAETVAPLFKKGDFRWVGKVPTIEEIKDQAHMLIERLTEKTFSCSGGRINAGYKYPYDAEMPASIKAYLRFSYEKSEYF